ncbi:unnamed protein product, partial [Mesorhabditis spiculigera]
MPRSESLIAPNITRSGGLRIVVLHVLLVQLVSSSTPCHIPFKGLWWQGERQVLISDHHWGNYGECLNKNNDHHFLLKSNISRTLCFRCVIAFPVHENVVQFKATSCLRDPGLTLHSCRNEFRGDAPMITLFKAEAKPEKCPLETPLNFTYSTAQGTCHSRISSIQPCVNEKKLKLDYKACPELPTVEASGSELECLGSWQSMGAHFIAARISAHGKRPSHRCLIVEGGRRHGNLGISADSSCQELTHLSAASKLLAYKLDTKITAGCEYPDYLQEIHWKAATTAHSHRFKAGTWHSSHSATRFSNRLCIGEIVIDAALSTEESRSREKDPIRFYRTHTTEGCSVGFQCVRIKQISRTVVQLEFGIISPNEYEPCDDAMVVMQRETLVEVGARTQCPSIGRHYIPTCKHAIVESGCSNPHHFHLRKSCTKDYEEIICLASWADDENEYFLAKHHHQHGLQCFVLHDSRVKAYPATSCDRESTQYSHPALDFITTHSEQCSRWIFESLLSSSFPTHFSFYLAFLVPFLAGLL